MLLFVLILVGLIALIAVTIMVIAISPAKLAILGIIILGSIWLYASQGGKRK